MPLIVTSSLPPPLVVMYFKTVCLSSSETNWFPEEIPLKGNSKSANVILLSIPSAFTAFIPLRLFANPPVFTLIAKLKSKANPRFNNLFLFIFSSYSPYSIF